MNFKEFFKKAVSTTLAIGVMTSSLAISSLFSITSFAENETTSYITVVSDKQLTYNHEGYSVDYSFTEAWNGDHSVSIVITNTGVSTIENWSLGYNFGGTIQYPWGGTVITNSNDKQYLHNAGYNANIAPNGTAAIGYTLASPTADFPDYIGFIQERVVRSDGFTYSLDITSNWENNINGIITINNTSTTPIAAWELSFESNFAISDSWVAGIQITQTSSGYKLKGVDDSVIEAGTSVSLAFAGTIEDENIEPAMTNVSVTEIAAVLNDKDDKDKSEIDYETDTDSDGLPDFYEELLGTDPENPDTDGDGLPDGYEALFLGTNPTLADTNSNGVSDANEDFDNDNLSNIQEFQLETNPLSDDTDEDGLKDGDEINTHLTDPKNHDTDGDGILDGDESALGFNPTLYDTNGDGISDGNEKIQQTFSKTVETEDGAITNVSVDINAINNINRTMTVESVMHKDVMSTGVVGLVGEPFEINTTSQFETATIKFTINQANLGETNFDDLLFLWYDEANHHFVEIETTYDSANSIVSMETTHFSKYMIVNKNIWYAIWANNDYISMGSNDLPNNTNTSGISENLPTSKSNALSQSKTFGDSNYLLIETTNLTWQQAEDYCENLGGHLVTITSATENVFVFDLINKGAKINYWLGGIWNAYQQPTWVTGENFNTSITQIVDDWGESLSGHLCTSKIGGDLMWGKGVVTKPLNYYKSGVSYVCEWDRNVTLLDSDNDGFPDLYETMGILVENGDFIKTNPSNPDTDGDGIPDGEEINPQIKIEDIGFVPANAPNAKAQYHFEMFSDPTMVDSDEDGYDDAHDKYPRTPPTNYELFNKADSLNFVPEFVKKFKELHTSESNKTYNSKKLSSEQMINLILRKNYALDMALVADPFTPDASSTLAHFLENTGIDLKIDMNAYVLTSSMGLKHYKESLKEALEYAQDILKYNGDSILIVSRVPKTVKELNLNGALLGGLNWTAAIGRSSTYLVTQITLSKEKDIFSGDYESVYEITGRYELFDFYDWHWETENEKNSQFLPFLRKVDLFEMHEAGIARDFYIWGNKPIKEEFWESAIEFIF
ncbi:hypothetical protein FACS189499_08600 [Clostridia bacterium]|nr:hypothetical protein FACS189499_08600 [Clostridia bacterium]